MRLCLNEAVDQVRKREHRTLHELGIEMLGGTNWDWLYNRDNLPPEREMRFEELRQFNLKTVRAHAIKETFRCFWGYTYPANVQRFITAIYFHGGRLNLEPQ